MAWEQNVHVWYGELPSPPLFGVLYITLHVLASHRAILGREMILWKVTKVFVVELELLAYSETWQRVPDGRCPWQSVTVSSSRVPRGGWRGPVPASISTFPSLVSHNKALSVRGAPGCSVRGAGREPLVLVSRMLQPPLSPAWTRGNSLTRLQLLFLQKGSFSFHLPCLPCHPGKQKGTANICSFLLLRAGSFSAPY